MKNFHIEFPRVFDRIPFVALNDDGLEIGYGRYACLIGKWFITLNV
jgi:hypothetical protein